jgi:hypothetical protein
MLGHANISQADSYLRAAEMGLQVSTRQVDASRCKSVAKQTAVEYLSVGNANTPDPSKGLLH